MQRYQRTLLFTPERQRKRGKVGLVLFKKHIFCISKITYKFISHSVEGPLDTPAQVVHRFTFDRSTMLPLIYREAYKIVSEEEEEEKRRQREEREKIGEIEEKK